jgi:hypothetical protein
MAPQRCFPNLPTEIEHKIWDLLLKRKRILTVRRHVYQNLDMDADPDPDPDSADPDPADPDSADPDSADPDADADADAGRWRIFSRGSVLLRINKTSRVYALNFYQLLFPGQTKPNLYFHPEYDTVYLPTPWNNKSPYYALPEYPKESDGYKMFAWMLQKFMWGREGRMVTAARKLCDKGVMSLAMDNIHFFREPQCIYIAWWREEEDPEDTMNIVANRLAATLTKLCSLKEIFFIHSIDQEARLGEFRNESDVLARAIAENKATDPLLADFMNAIQAYFHQSRAKHTGTERGGFSFLNCIYQWKSSSKAFCDLCVYICRIPRREQR